MEVSTTDSNVRIWKKCSSAFSLKRERKLVLALDQSSQSRVGKGDAHCNVWTFGETVCAFPTADDVYFKTHSTSLLSPGTVAERCWPGGITFVDHRPSYRDLPTSSRLILSSNGKVFITFFFFETRKLKLKEAICPYPQGRQKRWSQASRPACFS